MPAVVSRQDDASIQMRRTWLGSDSQMDSPYARDFARVPLNGRSLSLNGSADDEGAESVNIPMPSGGSLGAGGRAGAAQGASTAAVRPTGTQVDTVTDFTQAGLQAGYRSGYGIIARMRVLPDQVSWDGDHVVETVWQESSSCPATLTNPGPCSGSSTFPIGGASGRSAVIPPQPAMRNRFYDFHVSRSRDVSFLHDATRNPAGLNACQTVCRQDYAYNGIVIGSHAITRQFRKGTFGGRDVTIIDVTKNDLRQGPGDFPVRTLPAGEAYASATTSPASATGEVA